MPLFDTTQSTKPYKIQETFTLHYACIKSKNEKLVDNKGQNQWETVINNNNTIFIDTN